MGVFQAPEQTQNPDQTPYLAWQCVRICYHSDWQVKWMDGIVTPSGAAAQHQWNEVYAYFHCVIVLTNTLRNRQTP